MFQNETIAGRAYMVLTAYFVRPGMNIYCLRNCMYLPTNLIIFLSSDTICSTGRTLFDLIHQGTGTGLWFQNGRSTNDLINVPRTRAAASALGWTDCECYPGMGLHNFFEVGHNFQKYQMTSETNFKIIRYTNGMKQIVTVCSLHRRLSI